MEDADSDADTDTYFFNGFMIWQGRQNCTVYMKNGNCKV